VQAGIGEIDVAADDALELGVRLLEVDLAVPQRVVGVEAYKLE
jgi:hypothetical protein